MLTLLLHRLSKSLVGLFLWISSLHQSTQTNKKFGVKKMLNIIITKGTYDKFGARGLILYQAIAK